MPTDRDLSHTTVAILCTDGVEQVELTRPWNALADAGATVHLVSPTHPVQAYDHLDEADTFETERQVDQVNPSVYDALVLPGGVANPDALRLDPQAVALVESFVEAGKLIAAICHAPWLLVEADAVANRRLTSWPSLETDLRNAGATWLDQELVVDEDGPDLGPLITSRKPADLDVFVDALIEALAALPSTADAPC
ncbi:MAG: type 1 glutamine amidotransferase [Acidimicrobiales bacterium]|nr:type 1 glutamine amidotransferase [Acidimicrobiales bacterium]